MICERCKKEKELTYEFTTTPSTYEFINRPVVVFSVCIDCLIKEKTGFRDLLLIGDIKETDPNCTAHFWLARLCDKPKFYSDEYVKNKLIRYKKERRKNENCY